MARDDPSFALRAASAADLAFAWSLYRELMKPLTEALLAWDDGRQKAVVERDLASGQVQIIMVAGRNVGWLQTRETENDIALCQLYLRPALQNRGIGSAILRQLMERARDRGKAVTLAVMKNNRARVLYQRLGFVQTSESEHKICMSWHGLGAG